MAIKNSAPIEKNIIVTDVFGNKFGKTYPKRARGLVKRGRAEYVSDCEIRLLSTQAPTVEYNTEEHNMSKIIEFNARDYKLDNSCDSNVGERIFLTTSLGIREVWEIGDWEWNRAQIFCEKTLEKNTDYTLRFAVSGGYCDTWDAVSKVYIYHTDGYPTQEAAWEDRMTFPLDNDRFAPVISKKDRTGVIRVFEMPFNTGDFESWRIVFVAMHAVARFMAAGEISDYDRLEDLTIEQLLTAEDDRYSSRISPSGEVINDDDSPDTTGQKHFNTRVTDKDFADMLMKIGDGGCEEFTNFAVVDDSSFDGNIIIGECIDGAVLNFTNASLTSLAVSAIIAKLGDGCVVSLSNVNVTPDGIGNMLGCGSSDGVYMDISNAFLPKKVLELIERKAAMGDGCTLEKSNVFTFPA